MLTTCHGQNGCAPASDKAFATMIDSAVKTHGAWGRRLRPGPSRAPGNCARPPADRNDRHLRYAGRRSRRWRTHVGGTGTAQRVFGELSGLVVQSAAALHCGVTAECRRDHLFREHASADHLEPTASSCIVALPVTTGSGSADSRRACSCCADNPVGGRRTAVIRRG